MTRESKDLLIKLINRELEEEEKCDMLESHQDYIKDLIRAKKEILQTIYKKKSFIDVIVYGEIIKDDIDRYIIKE